MFRYQAACNQVARMIQSKVKKGNLADIMKISKVWEDDILEGKVKLLPLDKFRSIAQVRPTGFTKINLVMNPDSLTTPTCLIHDYTAKVNNTTLSLELVTLEKSIGNLGKHFYHYVFLISSALWILPDVTHK